MNPCVRQLPVFNSRVTRGKTVDDLECCAVPLCSKGVFFYFSNFSVWTMFGQIHPHHKFQAGADTFKIRASLLMSLTFPFPEISHVNSLVIELHPVLQLSAVPPVCRGLAERFEPKHAITMCGRPRRARNFPRNCSTLSYLLILTVQPIL